MAIYEFTKSAIAPLDQSTFAAQGWRERDDLQRLLRDRIELVSPETLVIAEEFSGWDESSLRIDLLGVDKQANLVVIELKRTQDGGHMDLQAIHYAAMISTMKFDRAVDVFAEYLGERGRPEDARQNAARFPRLVGPRSGPFCP